MKKRVGVLISGTGSNMQALVAGGRNPASPYEVVCIASNRPEAKGISWAQENGIATQIINHKNYATREEFDAALNDYLQTQKLDIIACAGFMRIMTPVLISHWAGRMLNIHPSLLPKYKGINTHQRAIDSGDRESGCTVHWVTSELDSGPLIAQARVPILPGDTADVLAARILSQEHKLYPEVLAMIAKQLA